MSRQACTPAAAQSQARLAGRGGVAAGLITNVSVKGRQETIAVFYCIFIAQLGRNLGCMIRSIGSAIRGTGDIRADGRPGYAPEPRRLGS